MVLKAFIDKVLTGVGSLRAAQIIPSKFLNTPATRVSYVAPCPGGVDLDSHWCRWDQVAEPYEYRGLTLTCKVCK